MIDRGLPICCLFPDMPPLTRVSFRRHAVIVCEKGEWTMCLVVPNEGEVRLLDMLVGGDSFTDVRLRLYKNNYTPVAGSTFGDFTQADFSGYAEETPAFGSATVVNGKGTIVDAAARLFIHTGGGTANTVYGYYVVDDLNNEILWAERFPSPILMSVAADQIAITLQFALGSAN